MPYTPIDVMAKSTRMPALTSETPQMPALDSENGMIANAPIAQKSEMNGASR